jgi:hypothetical protein
MSIERELLKKVISGDNKGDFFVSYDLYKEIYEFLAQPEQEPEAWIIVNKETGYRTQVSDLTPFLYHREIFEVIPLYTAPPKREQTEQEPVSWMVETHFNNEPIKEIHTVKPMDRVYKYCKVTELYTATPKRELLGDGITADMYRANKKATHPDSYWAGVNDAEKAHGIGEEK